MNQQFVFEAEPFEFHTEFDTELEGEVISRNLPIKFRSNFNNFREEVARGIGRWTIFRTDQGRRARQLAISNEKVLKGIHEELKNLGVSDGKVVPITAQFIYEGQGPSRRVKQVKFGSFNFGGNIFIFDTAP